MTLRPAVLDSEGKESVPALLLNYGSFVQSIIDFAIIAFVIFMVVKMINDLRRKQEAPVEVAGPSEEVQLLTQIRDALNQQKN